MKLFINTGGKGERLYPLTLEIPKPMVKICSKPILHHLIDWAKINSIEEVVLMNGYKAEKIMEYFGDGSQFGIKITHSTEPYPLGSGGPIKYAKKHIDRRFAYIPGDLICDADLKKMENFHDSKNSQITVLVHKSSHPHDSDILEIEKDFRVKKFVSKHEDHSGCGNLSNAGLCIIEPEILDVMEEEVFNFENYLFPKIIKKNLRFFAYLTDEFIIDIGTMERLRFCEEYLRSRTHFQD